MATSVCYSSRWEMKSNPVHSETGRDCEPWRPADYSKRNTEPVSQAQALEDLNLAFLLLQRTCSLSFESGLDWGIASCSWCSWSCLGSSISQVSQSFSYSEWGLGLRNPPGHTKSRTEQESEDFPDRRTCHILSWQCCPAVLKLISIWLSRWNELGHIGRLNWVTHITTGWSPMASGVEGFLGRVKYVCGLG